MSTSLDWKHFWTYQLNGQSSALLKGLRHIVSVWLSLVVWLCPSLGQPTFLIEPVGKKNQQKKPSKLLNRKLKGEERAEELSDSREISQRKLLPENVCYLLKEVLK